MRDAMKERPARKVDRRAAAHHASLATVASFRTWRGSQKSHPSLKPYDPLSSQSAQIYRSRYRGSNLTRETVLEVADKKFRREARMTWRSRSEAFAASWNRHGSEIAQCDAFPSLEKKRCRAKGEKRMAEREGFEPPVDLRLHLISNQARSTGLRHLSARARNLAPHCAAGEFLHLSFSRCVQCGVFWHDAASAC